MVTTRDVACSVCRSSFWFFKDVTDYFIVARGDGAPGIDPMLKAMANYFYRGHSPYYYLRKHFFILNHWREYQRRRRNVPKLPDCSKIERLNKEGWCDVQLDPAWVKRIAAYCCEVERDKDPNDTPPKEGPGKDFWRLLIESDGVYEYPEIVRFASQDALKDLASAYLGEEAVLSDVALMKSYPTGRMTKHSQLWHLDGGDSRILLFYVYCRDVDEKSGPFTIIRKSGMKPMHRPRFLRKYGYTDAQIQELCQPGSVIPITGPAGTVFGCDPAQTYHQGSRCETKTRLALGIRYTTFSGLYPIEPIIYKEEPRVS